jgi:hypothetical protein
MQRPTELAGAGGQPFLCDRSPSMASGAPARLEGAPNSGGAARVGEGAARRGTAGGGARPLLRSWRAPPPLLLERSRPADRGASPGPAGPTIPVRDFESRNTGEKKRFREGVFTNFLFNGLGR